MLKGCFFLSLFLLSMPVFAGENWSEDTIVLGYHPILQKLLVSRKTLDAIHDGSSRFGPLVRTEVTEEIIVCNFGTRTLAQCDEQGRLGRREYGLSIDGRNITESVGSFDSLIQKKRIEGFQPLRELKVKRFDSKEKEGLPSIFFGHNSHRKAGVIDFSVLDNGKALAEISGSLSKNKEYLLKIKTFQKKTLQMDLGGLREEVLDSVGAQVSALSLDRTIFVKIDMTRASDIHRFTIE